MENGKQPACQSRIGLSNAEIKELGLTKREYFTVLILQSLLNTPSMFFNYEKRCEQAVNIADTLLNKLENESI